MRGRAIVMGLVGVAALAVTAASLAARAPDSAANEPQAGQGQAQVAATRRAAEAAAARADRLARAAAAESDAARRAAAEERALAGRVDAAEAALTAARARATAVEARLAWQRARLGRAQAPVARLLAALQGLARRPAVVTIAQPGSVDDMVHVRAVLGSALPVVRARTAGLRGELVTARALAAEARGAADDLRGARGRLEGERTRLARLEAAHRERAGALGRGAMSESDRALALGERARDLVDRLDEEGTAAAMASDLAALPGPVMRPLPPGAVVPGAAAGAYRLPVSGRLVTGMDEVSRNGVRSRGLTFAVAPGAMVVAPAGGMVRYAARFRDYWTIVIVDHGDGWSTLVTGLGEVRVRRGAVVAPGAPIGQAVRGDEPLVTVELRRRGRPMDITALLG
ncbi:Septal ring factor EnvC, activator of murein hydrolases AmiA and AmiB [Sphingomonas gellani]|uniref:Septal ring factor EnvC, activator of murein hydrolases AmiA and AmiB n=1 Tax=Sphingomonas gellani TaxID=1166340 RepID=A0A1H8IV58_9SPHN|nr:peptidoglycan DD-metalloendopeptidase family protein [Sphingomonas gellani]SEN72352.1 Septal ring factor EnvC, activator of murein hydrolases AmiA and AmiB [Sphingomonas gellani]